MSKYSGMVVYCGRKFLRSQGCREQAIGRNGAGKVAHVVIPHGKTAKGEFWSFMLNQGMNDGWAYDKGDWPKDFHALLEMGFSSVTRCTHPARLEAFLKAAGIKEYKVLEQAGGWNSSWQDDETFIYIAHAVGRDNGDALSEEVPIPMEDLSLAGRLSMHPVLRDIAAEAFKFWFASGCPTWGGTESKVLDHSLRHMKTILPISILAKIAPLLVGENKNRVLQQGVVQLNFDGFGLGKFNVKCEIPSPMPQDLLSTLTSKAERVTLRKTTVRLSRQNPTPGDLAIFPIEECSWIGSHSGG